MKTRGTSPRRRTKLLSCIAACALLGGAAIAQEGPIVVGKREKPPLISLYNTYAEVEFVYRYRSENREPANAPRQELTENRFEQTISVDTQGHIYHPNLIELNLSGTAGLSQTLIDATDDDVEDLNGTILEYDLNALFLRKEVAPVTLYARRSQDTVNREFGPTFDSILNTFGAVWDIRSKRVPTRFEVYHSEQEQTGIGEVSGIGDFKLTQDLFNWHSEARPRDKHVMTWDYTLSSVTEENIGVSKNDYILNDANLSYTIEFGYRDLSSFTSAINFYDQSGDFPNTRFRWLEDLRLRHNESLETRYQFSYDHQKFPISDGDTLNQDRLRGTTGFTHWLYESLVTTGNFGVESVSRSDDSNSFEYFGDLRLDYTKLVPLGKMRLFGLVTYDWRDNEEQVNPTPVLDSPRVFNDPTPIIITSPFVDPTSIRVTDSSGLITFVEGLDYTINSFQDRTEINRIVGGRIPNGSVVLLDYLLVPQAANTTTTTSFSVGGRYDIELGVFKGMGVYARYTRQDQSIDSDGFVFIPNSFTDLTYGVEYRRNGFLIGIERENRDAEISPFDATRYRAEYTRRMSRDFVFNTYASFIQIDYPDEDNHVDLLAIAGSVQWQVSRELNVFATVVWRDENDDLRGPTKGLEEQIEFNWRRRQTTVYGLLRHSQLETDFQDSSFIFGEIGIRREF